MRVQKGFTLIELMIVILIVGILVGIAVPVFVNAQENSESKVCQSNLRTLRSTAAAYGTSNGTYPTSIDDLIPDYLEEAPICPAVGDSSAYVIVSGGGDEMPTFSCTHHNITR